MDMNQKLSLHVSLISSGALRPLKPNRRGIFWGWGCLVSSERLRDPPGRRLGVQTDEGIGQTGRQTQGDEQTEKQRGRQVTQTVVSRI